MVLIKGNKMERRNFAKMLFGGIVGSLAVSVEGSMEKVEHEKCKVNTVKVQEPNPKREKLIIVRVGTDTRPASDIDITDVQKQLAVCFAKDESKMFCSHAVDFQIIDKPLEDEFFVVKVGSDTRPASLKDVDDTRKQVETCMRDNLILVSHHVIEIQKFKIK